MNTLRVAPLIAAVLAGPAMAVTTVYSSPAAFLPNVESGSFTNTFTGPAIPAAATSYSFSEGAYSYTIAGVGRQPATWVNGSVIGNNYPNFALTVTFTSGNVTAIGADFFIMDAGGGFLAEPVAVTLSDGTVAAYSPTDIADTYRGFTSTTTIASLTLLTPGGAGQFNAIDNLTVGSAVPIPEPSSWALMGFGLAALLLAKRKAQLLG